MSAIQGEHGIGTSLAATDNAYLRFGLYMPLTTLVIHLSTTGGSSLLLAEPGETNGSQKLLVIDNGQHLVTWTLTHRYSNNHLH